MITASINRLQYVCENIPTLLSAIPEVAFSLNPSPGKWSKKEIIGHLIDSATNNHHRIVRAQFQDKPCIDYDGNFWNKHNFYRQMSAVQVISFWTAYNKHLLTLIQLIPQDYLSKKVETCETGEKNIMTIAEVIDDYVVHMEYHLRQVVDY